MSNKKNSVLISIVLILLISIIDAQEELGKYADPQNLDNTAKAMREAGLLEGELTPHQKLKLMLLSTNSFFDLFP